MRRRRRVRYEITHNAHARVWWTGGKWVDLEKSSRKWGEIRSWHSPRTMRNAMRSAVRLSELVHPSEPEANVVISKWYYKNGVRWCQEYHVRKR